MNGWCKESYVEFKESKHLKCLLFILFLYIRVVLLDFIEMVLTLEQETRIRNEKKRKIMSLRMDPEIIPDLMEKWIAGFNMDYVLKRKRKKNETRWMTKSSSNGWT